MSDERYTEDFQAMINIAILNSLGFFFMGFIVPVIARFNMNASGLVIGVIISLLVIGMMVSSSFVGILIDKVKSKKKLILIGSIGRALSYFIIYAAIAMNSLIGLGIGYFALGFMAGFFWIPFDTLVAEKSNKDHRSHAFGKRDAANGKGQLIGALIGFIILLWLSLYTDNPFLLYSSILIFGVANFIAGFKFIHDVDETVKFFYDQSQLNEPSKIKWLKSMIIGLIFLCCLVLISSINANLAWPFLNIYILENITDNFFIFILIFLPIGFIAIFLAPKLGKIVDKLNPIVGISIVILIGAIVTWFLINTTNILIFAMLLIIDVSIGLAGGLIFRNLLSRISIEHRGKVMGLSSFFTSLGSAIGPILGGYLWDNFNPKMPFLVSIYVELCLIPLFWVVAFLLIPHVAESFDKKEKETAA